MNNWQFAFQKLLGGIPLILGVTFISFVLMVYFGPDLTFELLGKNPTTEDISQIRHLLGYDQSFWTRYFNYLQELVTLDFGMSMMKDQPVADMLKLAIPVSLLLMIPGFILGNILAIALAIKAVQFRGQWQDKTIMTFSVVGMSISFLVVIIVFQISLSSSYGLDWFPVRGWEIFTADGDFDGVRYLSYVTVPTLATVFVAVDFTELSWLKN